MSKNESEVMILVRFSIPLILSGILQQMFNWADAFIVGNFVGTEALAAVGATTQICNLFIRTVSGFTSGVSILAARYYGAGETEKVRKLLCIFLTIVGGLYLVLSVVGIIFINPILTSMSTPLDIFSLARDYLTVIFLGLPFLAVYNIYYAVLRGTGDSRTPFMVVTYSGIFNVIMDYMFVGVFGWSVKGAALATSLSYVFMGVFVVFYAYFKHEQLRFRFAKEFYNSQITKDGFKLAIPITVQSLVKSTGNLVLQNFMNGFGTETVAAITTAYRVDTVAIEPVLNLGTAVSTMTSQSLGAKDEKKAKRYLSIGIKLMMAISLCLTTFILFKGEALISMFGVTPEVAAIGGQFFRGLSSFYIIYSMSTAFRCYLDGCGDVVYTGIVIIAGLGIRIVLSYMLGGVLGRMVIAYAEGICWSCWLVLFYVRYRKRTKNI